MSDLTDAVAALNELIQKYGVTQEEFADWSTGVVDGGPENNGLYPFTLPDGTTQILVPCPNKLDADTLDTNDVLANGTVAALIEDRVYDTQAALYATTATPEVEYGMVCFDPDPLKNGLYKAIVASPFWEGPSDLFGAGIAQRAVDDAQATIDGSIAAANAGLDAKVQLSADWAEKATAPAGGGTKSSKTWAGEAATSAGGAATSSTTAGNAATLAGQWANNPEDVVVTGGEYSAKHYKEKAADQADLAYHMANDNVNVDVPGGPAGSRGARYWSGQAQLAVSNLGPAMTKSSQRAAVPSVVSETHGNITDTVASALTGIFILEHASIPVSQDTWITGVQIKHTLAVVGRQNEIYIMRAAGGGNYTVIWASGVVASDGAGISTFAFTPYAQGLMQTGDVIGVWCSATTNANGISYANVTAGLTGVRRATGTQSRLTVGNNYGSAYTVNTTNRMQIIYTAISSNFMITTDWFNKAFGLPQLDVDGRIQPIQALFGGPGELTPSNTTLTLESGELTFRPTTVNTTVTKAQLTTGLVSNFANTFNQHILFYDATAIGFPTAGYLSEIRFEEGSNIPAGCKIQVWIIRPTSTVPVTASGTFTAIKVANWGEFDLSSYGASTFAPAINLKGRLLKVVAGDMIMLRGPAGFGWRIGSSTGYSNDLQASTTVAFSDLTMASLDNLEFGITVQATPRRLFWSYKLVNKYISMPDGAGGVATLDSLGNLANSCARLADLPLKNKAIVFAGSSISTVGGGGGTNDLGHLKAVIPLLQCAGTNVAIGGSFCQWSPSVATGTSLESQTIGATIAELTARFGGGAAQYSFENKLLGHGYYGFVLPDCINDTNLGSLGGVGTWADAQGASSNPITYYGVMSRLIEAILTENPSARIWLQTPFHRWASYTTPATYPTEQANREAYRAAAYDLCARYGLAGVIDYMGKVPCNRINVKNGTGLFDTIHPTQLMKTYATQVVYDAMNKG